MIEFWLGLCAGVLLTIPLIFLVSRRTARRVKKLEMQARAAERLAELGTLTGGLAHEIKNPLSTVALNLQLLGETLDESDLPDAVDSRLRSRIGSLDSETQRLKGILEDFLSFAGRVRLAARPLDINGIIEELIDFYLPQAEASGVSLRSQLNGRVGILCLDEKLVKQAMLNLLINATQAMVEARYGDAPHG